MKSISMRPIYRLTSKSLHIDFPLLGLLITLVAFGMLLLYSASNQNLNMIFRQGLRLSVAFIIMLIFAAIPPP